MDYLKTVFLLGMVPFIFSCGFGTGDMLEVSIERVSVNEGDSGSTAVEIPVTLSAKISDPTVVTYSVEDGTATKADGDYSGSSGTLVIPADTKTGSISISFTGDTKFENDETFQVILLSANYGELGNKVSTVTILNDDPMPSISIDDPSVFEGDSGTTTLDFTVNLSNPTILDVAVDYTSSDGTALLSDNDYTDVNGTLIITAGNTSGTVSVSVLGDLGYEFDETVFVNLNNPTNGVVSDTMGVGTILNDDSKGPFDADTYAYEMQWGYSESNPQPSRVFVDHSDNVYVPGTNNGTVLIYDNSGVFIESRGVYGTGLGEFKEASDIVFDSLGNIFLCDRMNNRINKYDSSWGFMLSFGSSGSGQGEFNRPMSIAMDPSDNLFVTDLFNHRIQKFNSNGVYLDSWGTQGSGNGELSFPWDIALDSTGNVYVTESGNDRIQKFTVDGIYLSQWDVPDGTNYIAVDSADNIYASYIFEKIYKYTSGGSTLAYFGVYGGGNRQFVSPKGICIDSGDNIFIADSGNYRIQKLDTNNSFLTKWMVGQAPDGAMYGPIRMTMDENGDIYVAEQLNNRIQKFDIDGNFILKWGYAGTGPGELFRPSGIAANMNGRIYISDPYCRIKAYDLNGNYLFDFGSSGTGDGEFETPYNIAVDSATGEIFVADYSLDRIQVFDSSGVFLRKWGQTGNDPGEFISPNGIAVDSEGNVFVSEWGGDRIQKFTSEGVFLRSWGNIGTSDGEFDNPSGIVTDFRNYVYIADRKNHRIQKFDSNGVFICAISTSTGTEEFRDVLLDISGNLYILDISNTHILKFNPVY